MPAPRSSVSASSRAARSGFLGVGCRMAENLGQQSLPDDQVPHHRGTSPDPEGQAGPDRLAGPAHHEAGTETIAGRPDDRLRVTTAERDGAEAVLRDAVDLGAIDLDEYGQRYRGLLEARTRGDIRRVLHDLPDAGLFGDDGVEAASGAHAQEVEQGRRWYVAVMGDNQAEGRWRPTSETTALAVIGSAKIDLREAMRPGDDIAVEAIAVMGDVEILVLPGTDVQMSGFAVMGDRTLKLDESARHLGQRVRLNATAVMGDVKVKSRPLSDTPTRRQRRFAKGDNATAGKFGATAMRTPNSKRKGIGGLVAAIGVVVALGAASLGALPAGLSVMGSSTVHVTEAELADADGPVIVDAYTLMGSTTVVVPEGTQVEIGGISILGSDDCAACSGVPNPNAPLVRVRGARVMGSLEVETPATLR